MPTTSIKPSRTQAAPAEDEFPAVPTTSIKQSEPQAAPSSTRMLREEPIANQPMKSGIDTWAGVSDAGTADAAPASGAFSRVDRDKVLSEGEVSNLPPVMTTAGRIQPPQAAAEPASDAGVSAIESQPLTLSQAVPAAASGQESSMRSIARDSPLSAPGSARKKPSRSVSFKEDDLAGASHGTLGAPTSDNIAYEDSEDVEALAVGSSKTGSALDSGVYGQGSELVSEGQKSIAPEYLSSADITEMPGIGRSIPETPKLEAGSVSTAGDKEPHTLTPPERGAVHMDIAPQDSGPMSPLTRIQAAHEAEEYTVCLHK